MARKLKLGFIGCGAIARLKHFPALMKLKNRVHLVAFCDITKERATKAAADFGEPGARVYVQYTELLRDDSLDVIYVLTPNVSHCEITVSALSAGKHVLCEKPMAITYAEAKNMLEAAKRSGKKLTIGYQNRFRGDSQLLYRACRNGDLGEIYFAKAHALRRRAVPTWGVFSDKAKQGGGPLIDIGTHALDLALWTMDNYKPKRVLGSVFYKLKDKPEGNLFGPWDPKTHQVEDSAFGLITMENGATVYLEACWALNILNTKEAQVTLCGTEAGAEMFGDAAPPTSPVNVGYVVFNRVQHDRLVEIRPSASIASPADFGEAAIRVGDVETASWLDAVVNDTQPVVRPEQALVVTQILEAIYQSAQTGRAIELTSNDALQAVSTT